MRLKHLVLAVPRNLAMAALWPRERVLLSRARGEDFPPPVFVVGPPRSGTTLVYEALVGTFQFAYISNLAHRLYRTPVAATSLGMRSIDAYEPRYESKWGHVSGWAAPNEAGWVWDRWFTSHDDAVSPAPDEKATASMRDTVGALSSLMRGPFLNKNVNHSVWMPYLAQAFPGATFVEVRRGAVESARSMLKARRDEGGDKHLHEWSSVKPRGWAKFSGENPETQCVAQAVLVARQIEEDAARLDPVQRLTISYDEFCADPAKSLEDVRWRLLKAGIPLRERRDAPGPFERRGAREPDDLALRLADAEARVLEALDGTSRRAAVSV